MPSTNTSLPDACRSARSTSATSTVAPAVITVLDPRPATVRTPPVRLPRSPTVAKPSAANRSGPGSPA
jgi:hypothetical protein